MDIITMRLMILIKMDVNMNPTLACAMISMPVPKATIVKKMVATSVSLSTVTTITPVPRMIATRTRDASTKSWRSEPSVGNSHFAMETANVLPVSLIVRALSVGTMVVVGHAVNALSENLRSATATMANVSALLTAMGRNAAMMAAGVSVAFVPRLPPFAMAIRNASLIASLFVRAKSVAATDAVVRVGSATGVMFVF